MDSLVEENDLQHQQSGLLTYFCRNLTVRRNQASYNSGYGIHLFGTCDCLFEENSADYCCRFEPREGGLHYGHMAPTLPDSSQSTDHVETCSVEIQPDWEATGSSWQDYRPTARRSAATITCSRRTTPPSVPISPSRPRSAR